MILTFYARHSIRLFSDELLGLLYLLESEPDLVRGGVVLQVFLFRIVLRPHGPPGKQQVFVRF